MKKTGFFKRLLSFVLCVCMLVPCLSDVLPLEIFAEGEPDLYVTDGKKKVTEIELPKNEKTDLTAVAENFTPSAYGWQVLADAENNVWAKIYDKNEKTIEVSHPLLYTILNEFGGAYLRAVGETEFGRIYSEPVFVLVTDPTSEESEEYVPNEPKRFLAAGSGITITINYLDGEDPTKSVYSPFTATLSGDSTYSQNVLSPTNIGYAPFWTGDAGDAAPTDGDTFEVTVGGETRTYTYDGTTGSFIDDVTSLVETDVSWLTALNTQVIASAATEDASIIHVSFDPVTGPFEDVVINVYYQAIEVPFSVRYYFQNINDDGYTLNAAISYNGLAKTGSIVSDEVLEQPVNDYYGNVDDFGFTPLYHYPEAVAADGSTVFECYYDRNYYLIKFDMNGGYGVEPIYARYGSSFVVTPPTRPGYVFMGWDEVTTYEFNVYVKVDGVETQVGIQTMTAQEYVELGSPSSFTRNYTTPGGVQYENAIFRLADSYGDGTPDEATSDPNSFIGTIESCTIAYKAIWTVTNSNVTILYWKENANDNGYSYWGSDTVYAVSASYVGGDTDKIYKVGENYVTQTQKYKDLPTSLKTGDYNQFEISHADNDVLVEGDGSSAVNVYYKRRIHTITLRDTGVACQIEPHTHTDDCYDYLCNLHSHTLACYGCGLEEVPHTEDCCSLPEHTHTSACLLECDKEAHTHTDACYNCGFAADYQHTHTAACCAKEVHVHTGDECCSVTVHTHTDACCDLPEHVHNGTNCNYLICSKHAHDFSCYTSQSLSTTNDNIEYASYINNPVNGTIYRYRRNNTNCYTFFYYNDTWYFIGNTGNNNSALSGSTGGISFSGNLARPGGNGQSTSVTANRNCGQPDHAHTAACYSCGKIEAPHTLACYTSQNLGTNNLNYTGEIDNPVNGTIYRYHYYEWHLIGGSDNVYYNYFYVNDTWYYISNASGNTTGSIGGISFSGTLTNPGNNSYTSVTAATACTTHHKHDGTCCTLTAHTHGDGTCNLNNCPTHGAEHTHGDGHCVYDKCGKTAHTHTDGTCVYTKCGLEEHTHTDACLQCGKEAHVHSEACQYACGKTAHTHTAACCTTEEHNHSLACYTVGGTYHPNGANQDVHISTSVTNYEKIATVTINGVTLYYNSQANSPVCVKIGDELHPLYYGGNANNTIRSDRVKTTYYYFNNLTFTQTCSAAVHSHGDGNCTYGCGIQEHTHNDFCYGCGKTAHAHGDGSCNALACTNPDHHTHNDACLICGFTESHVHTADCPYGLICTKPEHSHSTDDGTRKIVKIIQAKYGQTIVDEWNFTTEKDGLTYPKAGKVASWTPVNDSQLDERLAFLAVMTDRDITFNYTDSTNPKRYYNYYIECLPGETGVVTRDGKNYKYYMQNGTLEVNFGIWTRPEDFFAIDGFVAAAAYNGSSAIGINTDSENLGNGATVSMYYDRSKYKLDIFNVDGSTISSIELPFETSILPYVENIGTPPYPSTLEPNAYVFDGWYTTAGCYAGSELKGTEKMPSVGFAVHAKWSPVRHTVRFFETYDDMLAYEASVESGSPDESLVYVKQTMPDEEYTRLVEHGKYVGSIPNPDKLLVTNPGGSTSEYDFAGWFYIQNESKKAFTPLDMPINGDMNIYADWGTHTAQPYAIHYALDENEIDADWLAVLGTASETAVNREKTVTVGTDERTYICLLDEGDTYHWHRVIADATQGYAYQGTTRTFAAKAGENYHQLYDDGTTDFNEGYYPMPASHSITMVYEENSIEPRSNVFTFRYVYVEEVDYWIRYIDTTTGERMLDSRGDPIADIEKTTKKAVVTERFRPFTDYLPDAFYKQCILAVIPDTANPGHFKASPENVITFYYTPNDSSAKYTVHFLLQNSDEASRTLNASDFVVNFDTDPTSDEYGTYTFSDKFTESASRIDGIADKDTPIPIIPIDFAGFELIRSPARTVEFDGVVEFADATTLTLTQNSTTGDYEYIITPVTDGTDVFLFYQRKPYPYKIYHLLYGTSIAAADLATYTTVDTAKGVLAATESGTALYETDFTGNAKTIDGYVCVTALSITKDITPNEAQNYIVFFYTREQFTAQYKVWSGGGGTLDNTIETIESGSAFAGSTATASVGYKFEGWFVDADCTVPATYNAATNPTGKGTTYTDSGKTTPAALGPFVYPEIGRLVANGQQGSDGNIFYAKFTPLLTDLVIRRAAGSSANEGIGDQIFVYEIKNDTSGVTVYVTMKASESVAVLRVMEGQYTITQINDWSHRFEDTAQTVTVTASSHTVTFDDPAATEKWLNGSSERVTNTKGATP